MAKRSKARSTSAVHEKTSRMLLTAANTQLDSLSRLSGCEAQLDALFSVQQTIGNANAHMIATRNKTRAAAKMNADVTRFRDVYDRFRRERQQWSRACLFSRR